MILFSKIHRYYYVFFKTVKCITFFSFLIFQANITYSQFQSTDFKGLITTNDSVIYPYEINITRIGHKYVGYSISDRGGVFETKTSLKIQKRKNTIYVEEDRIIYTKADFSTFDDFCLMSFETNDIKLFNKKKIKSSFNGFFRDGTSCISGFINLMSSNFIEKKILKTEKRIEKSKIINKILKDSIERIKKKISKISTTLNNKTLRLTKNEEIRVNFNKYSKIYIQDWGSVDGDKIGAEINGEIQNDILLLKEKIKLPINKVESSIKLIGLDHGKSPPITAKITIENKKMGNITIKLLLKAKESCYIYLTNNFLTKSN